MYLTNIELIAPPETLVGFAPIIALASAAGLASLDVTHLANGLVLLVSLAGPDKFTPLQAWKLAALDAEIGDNLSFVVSSDPDRVWGRVQ
jgi:hypothetical protein